MSYSTSTPINRVVFFGRIPVVLENRGSSRGGGGGAHPLYPPPRLAPAYSFPIKKTIESTLYCPHLPNMIIASWL